MLQHLFIIAGGLIVKLFCVIIFHEERSSSFCEAYTEIIFNPNRKDKITHLLSYVTKPKVKHD